MERLRAFVAKHREKLAYLFFGGVTTLVNFASYALLHTALGMPSDPATIIAWALSVATAYVTNRRWVFMSHSRGREMLREFRDFTAARVLTGLLDLGEMHVAVEVLGPRLVPMAYRPLWDNGMKMASSVIVIVLNYVLSKAFIFKEHHDSVRRRDNV